MRTPIRILSTLGVIMSSLVCGSAFAVEAPLRIMPIGDSLTSGVSTYSVNGAYRNRLYTLLSNAGYNVDFVGTFSDSSNPGLPDINHQGQGSARIDQIQANIAGWLNGVEDPDVILLMIGTNDFWQNYDIANAQTRLSNLIGDIATRRPFAKIIVATLPLRTDSATFESQQSAYNAAIPGIVAQQVAMGRQVTYVDIHASLTSGDINGDGVHPSQAGFDKIADAWYPAVAAVVTPTGTSNPPVIAKIGAGGSLTSLPVVFSKPVADTAATIGNFSLSGGLTISGAVLDSAKRTVTLTTSAQTPGIVYNLSVTGVKDRTAQQRLIAPGSMISFSSSALSNGSFESDYAGWTKTGNSEIKSSSPYVATNGSKVLAFNTGQSTPNGTVFQTFATTPGQTYQLSFDVGAFGYTTASQRVQVTVQGSSSLVSDSTTVTPLGNGTTRWVSKAYSFTANSATTTLTFTDTSTTSNSVDLILDNVIVGPQSSKYLAVTSSPDTAAPISVSPSDSFGNGNGNTGFLRSYATNASVTVTAPASHAGKSFLRWQKNGVDLLGSGAAVAVTMDGDHALNAVYGSNSSPVAVADAYAATANSTLTVPAIGVLTNDSDADGNPLTAILNAAPLNGTVSLNPNGSFTYTPNSGYVGADSFSYHANDGSSDSNVVTVSLTVSASSNQLVSNGSFENDFTGWTTSGNLQIKNSSPYVPTNGTKLVAFNTGNSTPNAVISQSFPTVSGQTYQLNFDLGVLAYNSSSQRVQLAVTGSGSILNQAITVSGNGSGSRWFPQSFTFVANSATTTLSFTDTSTTSSNLDMVLDNVRVTGSAPNYTLTVASSPSSNVAVAISPPDRNSASGGSTSFTRSYTSGSIVNLSAPATAGGSAFQKWQKNGVDFSTSAGTSVTIDADVTMTAVYGVNTAPIAVADSYSTPVNTVLAIPASGVLSNDSDPELNPITAVLNAGPANGTLTLNPNGGFSYTPTTGFTGTDSFTYHATDGSLDSNVVTVSITVIGGGSNTLVNGGFENGETGWTITGNRFVIDSTPPYIPYEGNKLAVLNGGNQAPNAVFSQTFATTPGNSYVLAFEMGVIATNTNQQKLAVTITGSSSIFSTLETVTGNGLNNAVWSSKSYVFTANSANTTISFSDASTSTSGIDLLLDNVRVNGSGSTPTQTLTVNSSPATGVAITVSPVDNSSNGNGTTQFTRTYNTNTVVSLTAPATFGTDTFVKWQKNGADLTTNLNASVTMDAAYTLTAVYQAVSVPTTLVNGSFEDGENGWTVTGNRFVIDSTPPYIPFEGNKLAVLNGGNQSPNAVFSQTFATTPGYTYVLAFEMGVIGINTSQQKLGVGLTGSGSLLSTTETVTCNGLNTAVWTPKSFTFTANSATTTVAFTDQSTVTSGVDLLLDNVRVTNSGLAATQSLAVTSSPATAVPITVTPVDNGSNGNGSTNFTRTYDSNTVVSLTAPATSGTDNFVKWQKNGADLTTSLTATVTMDGPLTLNAVYQAAPPAPDFANGGFENGENSWTMTGNRVVIDTTPPYLASEGSKLLVFNGGNTSPNATVTQTFRTTIGQTYDLTFDVGILAGAAIQQKLKVEVNGTASHINQTETLVGNALGNTVWTSKTYSFTADSAATTLKFTDVSTTTNGADLLLDKVSVGSFAPNTAPVAVADSYVTNKNTQLIVSASGVLSNDTDADTDPLTAVVVTSAANGTLVLNANGGFTYTPATDFVGADSFAYKANDGTDDSNTVTVTINVTPPVILTNGSFEFGETGWTMTGNRLAYTADNSYLASDGSKLLVLNGGPATPNATISQTFPTIPGQAYVLSFDVGTIAFNNSTQKLKIELTGNSALIAPDFANLTGNSSGSTVYAQGAIPFTADSTTTTLTFTDVSTSTNGIDMLLDNVAVTLGTNVPNSAPVATANSYTTDANVQLVIPAAGVLSNDTDANNDPLTAVLVTSTSSGTLSLNPNGGFTYTPNSGFTGSDSFTYKANDGEADSNTATVTITVNAPVVVNGFVNGSFESDFTGWTTTGNVAIQSGSPYAPTNGTKLAAFNSGNTAPNGVLSQTFATTPGITYSLTFDAGVLSYTTVSQKLQLNVAGNTSLLSQLITITRTSGSNNRWLPQSFTFVADSATTTLSFTDTSATTNLLDLVLDNIVVTANTPVTTRTLTVASTPAAGANITVSPADNSSNGNGATQFTRVYNSGTAVTLTAPATFSGNTFSKWQKNGVDLTTDAATTITMDADQTLTAVYGTGSGSGPNLLTNGSFESNFTAWTTTGNVEIQSASPYTATDGTKLASFNDVNSTPNGTVSQSFATTPGATYSLAFDAGVLSYNTASQKLQVNVNGTASLLSQTVTITRSSGSNNLWLPQTFSFVADSATTTLTFTDTSATTAGLDLVLDNVRVNLNTAVPVLQTLTVNATPVQATISVSPNDSNGNSNGSTSFSRAYSANTVVTLTAPATSSGSPFIKWQKDNVDLTTDLTATVTMDTAHTMTAVYAHAAFANGSFETGTFSPWVTSGGTVDSVKINSVIGGTDGSKIVEFNSSNSPAGGVLSQTFATTAGVTYNLTFDLGVLAFNTSSQSIRVNVTGSSSLLNQTTSITPTTNGVAKWEAKSYSFTANSATTTLTFTDISTTTGSIDMLLDNVRVINANARTLTVDSVVASSVPLTISPADSNGAGDGTTALTRTYNSGSVVSITAPATAPNGATFVKWVKDGADFATTPATSLTITAHTKMFAVYSGGTYPALGPNLIQNFSFESLNPEYAYWAHSGSTRIEQPGSASGFTTHGNNLLSFNVGGTPNDGTVQQSFATTAGTTYTLQLDPGVYGGPNGSTITQKLNINVVGNAMLLSKSVTIQGHPTNFVWAPQTYTFTADSNTTTLILADGSSSGAGTDLFVDNVRVRAGTLAPTALTVTSTPAPGKVVTATPDLAEQGNGTTNFSRIYNTGASVAMVAPYQNFVKWLKNGQWYATNPSITVLADAAHTMTAVYTETPVLGPFTNGGFEQEFTGWTWTGSQQSVKVKDGLPTTEGLFVIEFNSNSSNTDGAISQTFTTTPGTVYTLNFDMGVNAFNTAQQSLRCLITGSGTLANQTFSMNNPSANGVVYSGRTMTFTANSATTTITFSDQSATGVGLDLLLDNVRLNGSTGGGTTTTRTLTVNSTPSNGAAITVSPADNSSNGNGTTQFTRTYNNNTAVTLTAPATFGGNNFSKWQKNGSDVTTSTSTTVTMDADYTLTAVYTAAPGGGSGSFTNGNFELDLTAWTATGSTNSVLIGSGLAGSNSSKVVMFNSANSANNGAISQTFNTVSGTTYTVTFDQGVLAYNTAAQTIQVSATGSGSLLSQNFTRNGTGSGNVVWNTRTVTFIANSATTTLTFRDVSSTGAGLDLLLDNVSVTTGGGGSGNTRTLTVNSTPNTGSSITVSPADNNSQSNGSTNFTRTYNTGATVSLVAPYQNFVKWLKNGAWYATNPSITVTLDADTVMTAVYTSTPVLGSFTNGSFEQEFTGWTWSGSQQSVKVKDGLPATNGINVIEFNSNSSANDGSLSQTFTTVSGTTYQVLFDMGVLAYNTSEQRLQVTATGVGSLNSEIYSLNGTGGGNVVWSAKTFTFTANSSSTTLTFADKSTTGVALDLLLDNVRLEVTTAPGMGPNLIYNGSFELSTPPANFVGWTQSGSNRIEWPGAAYSTDGTKILSYGVGETPTDGSVSQSFATVPGSTYRVRFDLGALGYNAINLTLRVKVDGSGTILNQTTSVLSRNDFVMVWNAKSFDFVANSTTTTLTLSDASASGSATDMFVDNVRVNSIAAAPAPAPAPMAMFIAPEEEHVAPVQPETTLPSAPTLTGTPGSMRITMNATEPGLYILERSEDLKNWNIQNQLRIEQPGPIEFQDTETGLKRAFYRIGKVNE